MIGINTWITNMINNIFHVVWLVCIILEPKYRRKKTIFIMASAGVFCQVVMIGLWYSGIFSGIGTMFFAAYTLSAIIYGGSYIFGVSSSPSKSLFLLSAYYSLWTFIYSTVSIVTNSFAGAGNALVWLLRIGLNLFFLCLYQFFFKKRFLLMYRDIRYDDSNITILSLLVFYMVTLLTFVQEKWHIRSAFYLWIFVSVYIFVLIAYVVLFRFMRRLNYEEQLKQMQFHEKLLLAQIESYEEIERNARQIRHDFRHHNIVVAEYAKNRDYQGILDYLQKYEEEEEEKYSRTFCTNPAIDHVLSAYVARAEKKGIEVKAEIKAWDTYGISEIDLVSIFANMLENAINGCMQVKERRQIELVVRQKGKKLAIICQNTCSPDIIFENSIPRNRNRHGVGVESILQSVGKYSGDADFSAESGVFTCRIVLCNILE